VIIASFRHLALPATATRRQRPVGSHNDYPRSANTVFDADELVRRLARGPHLVAVGRGVPVSHQQGAAIGSAFLSGFTVGALLSDAAAATRYQS